MKNKARVMTLSLVAAVPVYFWIGNNMPSLPPDEVYGGAAGLGFVVGIGINYLWETLGKER